MNIIQESDCLLVHVPEDNAHKFNMIAPSIDYSCVRFYKVNGCANRAGAVTLLRASMMKTSPKLQVVAVGLPSAAGPESSDLEPDVFLEVRAELRRVLNSSKFDVSERNRRFLEYVVEETLEGRAERIKAYNVATI